MSGPPGAIDLSDQGQQAATKSPSKSPSKKKLRLGAGGLPILEEKSKKTIRGVLVPKNWVRGCSATALRCKAGELQCLYSNNTMSDSNFTRMKQHPLNPRVCGFFKHAISDAQRLRSEQEEIGKALDAMVHRTAGVAALAASAGAKPGRTIS